MSEIVYCYTCNRGRPIEVDPKRGGWRTCSVCKNDELGETIDPALTGGRSFLYSPRVVEYQAALPKVEAPAPSSYATLAGAIAATVERKQAAYGDSFSKSGAVLAILYPAGIPLDAYGDALTVVRVVDKLFRVATDRDALEENPWQDIAGYALLAVRRVEADKGRA
jgi:hypothetical protein